MEGASKDGRRHAAVSDVELLRTIGHDLRVLYADVIKQPLPRNIEAALARIDREQSRAAYRSSQEAH